MNITLDDGRTELWQWDTGRKIVVDDDSVSEVHFSKYSSNRAITRAVTDGKAEIPDFLLQDTHAITVYAYSGSIENGYTKAEKTFNILKKPKPADYVATAADQAILAKLKSDVDELKSISNRISSIYYVELDGVYPRYTLSSATPIEGIETAYADGKALFCRCKIGVFTAVLPLFVPYTDDINENVWIFSGSGGITAFGLAFPPMYFTIIVTSDTGVVTVAAECNDFATVVKDYVDNNEVVINSSTEGSTKKFKITVDDSGTISATEVTT